MAAAAITAECMFSEAASEIVIGERCSRVARIYSFYPHVAHCGVGIWRDNRVAMDFSKCSSCMKRHRDLPLYVIWTTLFACMDAPFVFSSGFFVVRLTYPRELC